MPDPQANLSAKELLLTRTWRYDHVVARDQGFRFATANMELGSNKAALGGNRSDLFRRRIRYFADGTYQLQWIERGDYDLGTEGDPNWQPNYGFWELKGDSLIHNQGLYYKQGYKIELTDSTFSRQSIRYMSSKLDFVAWQAGDWVDQTEYFLLVK